MRIVQTAMILALCAPFVIAIWIAFVHREPATVSGSPGQHRIAGSAGVIPIAARFEAEPVDLEAAIRDAVAAIDPLARQHCVGIDLAVAAPMTVQVDPGALGTALHETLRTAIRATPGGQVLVTAASNDTQIHIRVSDDGTVVDRRIREMAMRGAETLLALQGGSLAVEARTGRGTTVTLRLPLPAKGGVKMSGPTQRLVMARQAA